VYENVRKKHNTGEKMGLKEAWDGLFKAKKPKEREIYEFSNEDRAMGATMKALNRQLQRKQKLMELREMKRVLDEMDDDNDDDEGDEEDEPQDDFTQFLKLMGASAPITTPGPPEMLANITPPSPPGPTPNPLVVNALEAKLPLDVKKWMAGLSEVEAVELARALHKRLKGT